MFVFIPALAMIYAGVGAAMLGVLGYETATGNEVLATGATPPAANAAAPSPALSPSAAEIESFAGAHRAVVELQGQYNQRIAASSSPQETEGLRREALDRMRTAIQDDGLTVHRYNEIYLLAQSDEALRQQVVDQIAALPPDDR